VALKIEARLVLPSEGYLVFGSEVTNLYQML